MRVCVQQMHDQLQPLYKWSVTCDRSVVSPGPPVSATNKTDHHDTTEILMKVALTTIKQTKKQTAII